jgi:GNAT superfamily N-acetyltransferase
LLELSKLNKRIHKHLRANAHGMPEHARIGCFVAGFDSISDNPYLNYAVPDVDAEPGEADIAALIAAFMERSRRPRLEYIPAAAPYVEPAMMRAGFAVEQRLPIMVSRSGDVIAQPADDVVADLAFRDEDLVEAAKTQALAFGDQPSGPDRLRRLLENGGLLAVARMRRSARIIGVGGASPLHEGVTEIAGIGVLPEFRCRGAASALAARLAQECFLCGANLGWLTPGNKDAERIYARAGFVCASEQLHISTPPN